MSSLIILYEPQFPALPKTLLVQEFGPETVVHPDTGRIMAIGTSMFINGDLETIREWIKNIGGKIWVSENPILGKWQHMEFDHHACVS